jgi:hypothetical protein
VAGVGTDTLRAVAFVIQNAAIAGSYAGRIIQNSVFASYALGSIGPTSGLSIFTEETVQSVREGWFRGSEATLEVFVHAVATERRLAAALRQADPEDDYGFDRLHRLHRGSAMLVASVATKLKLTTRVQRETR